MGLTKQERKEARAARKAEGHRQSNRQQARDEAAEKTVFDLAETHASNFDRETMDFDELPKWLHDAIEDSTATASKRAYKAAEAASEQAYDATFAATFKEVLDAEFAIALAKKNGTYDHGNERIEVEADNVVAFPAG